MLNITLILFYNEYWSRYKVSQIVSQIELKKNCKSNLKHLLYIKRKNIYCILKEKNCISIIQYNLLCLQYTYASEKPMTGCHRK